MIISQHYLCYNRLKPSIVEINEQNVNDPAHTPLNSVKRLLELAEAERKTII